MTLRQPTVASIEKNTHIHLIPQITASNETIHSIVLSKDHARIIIMLLFENLSPVHIFPTYSTPNIIIIWHEQNNL